MAVKARNYSNALAKAERKVWGDASPYPSAGLYRVAVAKFDPSANTGERTTAAHGLSVSVPNGALITRAWYDVITTFTTAGGDAGTITLYAQNEGDLVGAIAVADASNPWDAGRHVIPMTAGSDPMGLYQKGILKTTFNPSANAGERTAADHPLGDFIPNGSIITKVWYHVRTTCASTDGGADLASIAIGLNAAGDCKAAAVINAAGDCWDAPKVLPCQITAGEDTQLKLTAARQVTVTVGVCAMTAGLVDVYVEYLAPVLQYGFIKTTADRELTAKVAGQALTAGKLYLYAEYLMAGV